MESGDAKANDEAAALVQQQIKELEKTLELPELTASPDDEVRSALPLTVAFSVLRVSRDDPKEQLLIQMLLGSEPDLRERTEPMVFPVFGRGRALFALVGAGHHGGEHRRFGRLPGRPLLLPAQGVQPRLRPVEHGRLGPHLWR